MDLEVNRLESMGFEFTRSANGTVIPPKTTDRIEKKQDGIVGVSRKERDDSHLDRNKGALVVANKKMSLELPQGNELEAADLFDHDASLKMTYSNVRGKKAGMNRVLQGIVEDNDKRLALSEEIKKQSEAAVLLEKEAGELKYAAEMNKTYSQLPGAILGALGGLGLGAAAVAVLGLVGVPAAVVGALGACIGSLASPAVVSAALEWWTGKPQLRAIAKETEAKEIREKIKLIEGKQNAISTDISAKQDEFSMLSQSYNVLIGIMQTIISAFNDAKRSIAAGIR